LNILGIPEVLPSYFLEGIEAVPEDVVVVGDRVQVVAPEFSVRRPAPGGVGFGRCPLRNLAPERIIAGKVNLLLPALLSLPSYELTDAECKT
jgi:hypothetical protein